MRNVALLVALSTMAATSAKVHMDDWQKKMVTAEQSRQGLEDYLIKAVPGHKKESSSSKHHSHDKHHSHEEAAGDAPPPPCHACDVAAVFVPPSVAWVTEADPAYVDELRGVKDPAVVWDYWDRIEAAAATEGSKAGGRKKALHETCGFFHRLPLHRLIAAKHAAWARTAAAATAAAAAAAATDPSHSPSAAVATAAATAPGAQAPVASGPPGVLLHFRGDSHMRVTFQAVVRSMTREPNVLVELNFNTSMLHADKLACCSGRSQQAPPPPSSSSSLPSQDGFRSAGVAYFSNCTVESGAGYDPRTIRFTPEKGVTGVLLERSGHFADLRTRARERLAAGGGGGVEGGGSLVCVSWENRNRWRDDESLFGGNSVQRWADAGLGPGLVVAGGGAHYMVKELGPWDFGPEVAGWLDASAAALEEEPTLRDTILVVASSPVNG